MSVYVAFLPRKEVELGFWLSNGDSYSSMKTLNFEKSNHMCIENSENNWKGHICVCEQ
jgi:hypothetical protein